MKLTLACGQIEITPGRPDLNTKAILQILEKAKAAKVDVLLLPEMAVPGYLIGDLWEQNAFLEDCEAYGQELMAASTGITLIFGNVAVDWRKTNKDGRPRKYNAAFIAQNGKALAAGAFPGTTPYIIKNSLPDYREFSDSRHFYPLSELCLEEGYPLAKAMGPVELTVRGERVSLGVMLCEDGWTENYPTDVPAALVKNGAELLVNISCSPFTLGKNNKRHRVFGAQAKALQVPVVYCNNVGLQNNGKNLFTYDGHSCVYTKAGQVAAVAPMYEEALLVMKWDTKTGAIIPENGLAAKAEELLASYANTEDNMAESSVNSGSMASTNEESNEIATIYKAIRYGTAKFLQQCGITKMVLGISGGIDSAVAAALYTDILEPENVLLVNMPSKFNSSVTKNIAKSIAANLGTNYGVIPIEESVEHTINQLTTTPFHCYATQQDLSLTLSTLVVENIQARDRGARLLAALAAAFGGGFSCNANKAEITIGYATFYGDIAGVAIPLGDLWKHQVYALGRYFNEKVFKCPVLPRELFEIRPSAELSAAQTVGNGGDPLVYEYHDYLFRAFVENWCKASPAELLDHYAKGTLDSFIGCEQGLSARLFPTPAEFCKDLERWYRLFAGFAVAKRIQAPPIISITRRAYGFDQREAQLSPYFSKKYNALKEQLCK